eukprot:TRINITY_DN223_c0_g2_i5.p1 TRINITY_DN223_c0_g2~~TRINITY_DN223_c0_g2_i5.p1  ORF type:complete len:183 (-),score=2.13 TRINITY_DN223_c0_g2_i5:211-759(-)
MLVLSYICLHDMIYIRCRLFIYIMIQGVQLGSKSTKVYKDGMMMVVQGMFTVIQLCMLYYSGIEITALLKYACFKLYMFARYDIHKMQVVYIYYDIGCVIGIEKYKGLQRWYDDGSVRDVYGDLVMHVILQRYRDNRSIEVCLCLRQYVVCFVAEISRLCSYVMKQGVQWDRKGIKVKKIVW